MNKASEKVVLSNLREGCFQFGWTSRESKVISEPERKAEVTLLLRRWRSGDEQARSQVWEAVYTDLKYLARITLARKRSGADATSLVHKAYLRLMDVEVDWNDRKHFFLVAARAMRFILADEARRQLSFKRGKGAVTSLDALSTEPADASLSRPEEVISVHDLLDQLALIRPRQARLVELRYFAGLSVEESAEVLDVNTRTVVRDWRAAREWLYRKMPNPE
jgi:RNA polymerase sigma factor (TIGR02999 family)